MIVQLLYTFSSMKNNFFNKFLIAKMIKKGICFFTPTDTVCGLLSINSDIIYELKKRSKTKNIILLINDVNKIENLTEKEKHILNKFWPGELSVIKNNISYRMPNDKKLLNLLSITGPLYCSSANISNEEVINNWKDAKKVFCKNIKYITNKFNGSNIPSTIFDFDNFKIIRSGKIEKDLIELLKILN